MTLDELIAKLTAIKAAQPLVDVGAAKVFIRCPVAHADCWLYPDAIGVKPVEGAEDEVFVQIDGGFGA